MIVKRLLPALLASFVLAAAGCGGDGDEGGNGGGGGDTGAAETTAPETQQEASAAADTFKTTCGGCHTLAAAGTNGQVGPNLDQLKPDADRVKAAIEEGPGVMPSNLLQGAEADEVAQYVADNAGG